MQDGGFNAYDFKAEDEEEDADMEKLKALAGVTLRCPHHLLLNSA